MAVTAAVLMLAAGDRAAAQCAPLGPCIINATTTNTTSITHHETDFPGGSAGVIVPGNGPLQTVLSKVLAGPNGAVVLNALNNLGALGPKGPSSKQSLGTNTTVSNTVIIGPGLALYGPEQTLQFFVIAGNANINTNTHFENFFEVFPVRRRSRRAASAGCRATCTRRCRPRSSTAISASWMG